MAIRDLVWREWRDKGLRSVEMGRGLGAPLPSESMTALSCGADISCSLRSKVQRSLRLGAALPEEGGEGLV